MACVRLFLQCLQMPRVATHALMRVGASNPASRPALTLAAPLGFTPWPRHRSSAPPHVTKIRGHHHDSRHLFSKQLSFTRPNLMLARVPKPRLGVTPLGFECRGLCSSVPAMFADATRCHTCAHARGCVKPCLEVCPHLGSTIRVYALASASQ